MSSYGDWFRRQREQEQSSAAKADGSGRRFDLAAIDAQAAEDRARLQRASDAAGARLAQQPAGRTAAAVRKARAVAGAVEPLGSRLEQLAEEIAAGRQASGVPMSPGKAFLYGTERLGAGAAGSLEDTLRFLSSTGNRALSGVTSLGGLAKNPVSEALRESAEDVARGSYTDRWRESIERRYQPNQYARLGGDLSETGGAMAPSILVSQLSALRAAGSGIGAGESLTQAGQTAAGLLARNAGLSQMYAAAAQGAARQALSEGAGLSQAMAYGGGSGALEVGTELMFGGIPGLGKGSLSRIVKNPAVDQALDIVGEGVEEVVSEMLNPYIARATYDPDAQPAAPEDLRRSFLMGAASSGIMNLGVGIANRASDLGLGTNGQKNYSTLKERDGGKTPDFDEQYRHHYEMAKSGLDEGQIPAYASATPVGESVAIGAQAAGRNDGLAEARQTVQALADGKTVGDGALDRALAFAETRAQIAEQVGALPETPSQARQAVRDWQAARKAGAQAAAEADAGSAGTVSVTAESVSRPAEAVSETAESASNSAETVNGMAETVSRSAESASGTAESASRAAQPGVARNADSERVDRETVGTIDRVAKRIGVEVEFSEQVAGNGDYRDGRIRIRTDAENPVRQVFVHELTHHLETSGGYQAFAGRVIEHLQKSGQDVELQTAAIVQEYARQGVYLSEDGARRELVAKFAEEKLFTDARSIRRLTQADRSLGQKIRDWLHDMVIRLAGDAEQKFVQKAERMYAEALEGAKGRQTGETQHEIRTMDDGRQYVKADRQVIHGNDPERWLKQAERFIDKQIRNGEDITVFSADGNAMQVTERSAYKLTDPHVQSIQKVSRRELSGDQKALKAKIAGHIDELIQTAQKFKTHPDLGGKHQNDIGEDGFHYYYAYFENDDGQYYRVVFSAGINADEQTAYSIGQMDKRKRPAITGSSTNDGGAQGAAASSETSITQAARESKPQNPDGQKSYGGSLSELNARLAKLSEEEKKALKAENRRQKARIAQLENQLKRTPPGKRSETQVRRIAGDVLREYESKADRADITKRLQELYDGMAAGGEQALPANLYRDAAGIAVDIVRESRHLNDELAQRYKGLRDTLRTTRITLAAEDRLSVAEGYGDFRKRFMGRLRLVNEGGIGVDRMYETLRADYGEAFFPADISHPADRLERIGEVLDSLKPVYENPYANTIGDAAHTLALDLIGRGATVEAAKPTTADRFADRLERERRGSRMIQQEYDEEIRRHQETIADVRRVEAELLREKERRAKEVDALREHYKELDAKRRERKLDRIQREKLFKVAKRVDRMHAAPQNRAQIEEIVGTLDLLGIGIRQDSELRMGEVRDAMKKQAERDPDWQPNPQLLAWVERLDKMQIADMKIEDVEQLTKTLLALEHAVQNENRMIRTQDRRDVYEQAQETIRSIEQAKSPGTKGGIFSKNGYLSSMLSPERYVRRLVGYDDSSPLYRLTKDLSGGQRRAQDFEMRSERFFDKWHSDKAFMRKLTGKKADRIAIEGMAVHNGQLETVRAEITPAQQVSLYLHSKHYANRAHMLEGGVSIPDAALYAKGDRARAFAEGVRLRLDENALRQLTARMDPKVREYADAVGEYLNGMAKDAINETSTALDGYERATVKGYFPIRTDPNFTRAEYEGVKFDATLEGWGSLKKRQGSRNPLLLEDVTDVLNEHVQKTAQYYGLAVPVRNFNKLLNVTGTGSEWSVKEAISRKWGDGALKYINDMLADAQGARKGGQDGVGRMVAGLRSRSAGAVLTLSPSVIMKQAASYPAAAGVLGWKPLLRALNPQALAVDMDTIAKYTPDYWYRRKGYSTSELGDIASRKKGLPKLLNLIQGVDLATTRTLWLASEYHVREQNRGKADAPEIRSDGYYRQVAEVYNRVIEETQPNYAAMQRPGILRTQNELVKSIVMFKTQSFQNFNLLYDAYGNWRAKANAYTLERSGQNRAALKEARAALARNVSAQIVSSAVLSGMTFAAALAMGRTSGYEDDDGELARETVLAQLAKDFIGSFAGMAFGGSEAWSMLDAAAFGGTWFDVEAGGVSSFNDLFSRFNSVKKAAEDLWAAYGDDERELTPAQGQHLALQGWKLARTVAEELGGIPAGNVEKIFHALADPFTRWRLGKYVGQYYVLLATVSAESDSGAFIDLLYKAYREDSPEYETLHELVNGLGIDDERIASGLESRTGSRELLKGLLNARKQGDEEGRAAFRQALLEGELKTEKQIRDAEYSFDNKDVTEIVKAAYQAQEDGDTEKLESLRQALRDKEYTDEEIDEKLYALHISALQKTKAFEDMQSEVFVRIYDSGVEHPGYEMFDRQHREKFRSNVNTYSRELAMAEFEPGYPEKSWVTACRDAQTACGLSEIQFMIAYSAQAEMESIRDKNGETISNSKSLRKMQAIYQIPGLNDRQRAYMFEVCGVGKEVRHYNKALVEQKLREMERKAAR